MKDSIYFDEDSHRYFVNGNETDGVSALLESAGIVTSRFFKPEHAHRGKMVHEICRLRDQGQKKFGKDYGPYMDWLEGYLQFKDDFGYKPDRWEVIVHNKKLQYLGTYDSSGLVKVDRGRRYLVDLKSGAAAKWHPLQTAGYMLAAGVDYGLVVYLKKNGKYTVIPITEDVTRDFQIIRSGQVTARRYG